MAPSMHLFTNKLSLKSNNYNGTVYQACRTILVSIAYNFCAWLTSMLQRRSPVTGISLPTTFAFIVAYLL